MEEAVGGLAVLTMLVLIPVFARRIRAGHEVFLRRIPALDRIPHWVSQAVESGRKIHISLGTGGLTGSTTATTLAGLAGLDYLANQGCAAGTPPLVTVADPMVLLAAQDVLRKAHIRHGREDDYRATQVEMVAPQPAIYALGASTHLRSDETAANLMIGSFGTEALLLAEAGAKNKVAQVGGTDDPQAMALLLAATDAPIVGEEVFAVPAYLHRTPAYVASLQAQDVMRVGIVLLILVAVLLRTLVFS
jgi:hypothetical protein